MAVITYISFFKLRLKFFLPLPLSYILYLSYVRIGVLNSWTIDSWAVMKHGRFYCLLEKESGFKELVVYRTKWE